MAICEIKNFDKINIVGKIYWITKDIISDEDPHLKIIE